MNEFTLKKLRYMDFTIPRKLDNTNLNHWQKLYCVNFKIPPSDLNAHLERKKKELFELADDADYFKIDIENNPYLERQFQGEIAALRARGDAHAAEGALKHKQQGLELMAKQLQEQQQAEYRHIVDFFKGGGLSDAFVVLMLQETLSKVYYQTKDENGEKTFVQPRVKGKSIAGHMVLNRTTVDVILNNSDPKQGAVKDFATVYFMALGKFKEQVLEQSKISFDGVNTFDKGHWVKFPSKKADPANFENNVQELATLVQNTQWCTKTLAGTQLAHGDFYVFVSFDGKDTEKKHPIPRIAVKLSGNQIDEVRGVASGELQEIEPEYSDVAESFLENNKDIKQGKEWLEDMYWNKRLLVWNKQFENNSFSENDIEPLLKDYFFDSRNSHRNSNKGILTTHLEQLRPLIAKFLHVDEEVVEVEFSMSLRDYQTWYSSMQLIHKESLPLRQWCKAIDENQITQKDLEQLYNDSYIKSDYTIGVGKFVGLLQTKIPDIKPLFAQAIGVHEFAISFPASYNPKPYEKWCEDRKDANKVISPYIEWDTILKTNNNLTEKEIEQLVSFISVAPKNTDDQYAKMDARNGLYKTLEKAKILEKYFGVPNDQILYGDFNVLVQNERNNLKVVVGSLRSWLTFEGENLNLVKNKNDRIEIVTGNVFLLHDMGLDYLKHIDKDAHFTRFTHLDEKDPEAGEYVLPSLETVAGDARIEDKKIFCPALKSVGGKLSVGKRPPSGIGNQIYTDMSVPQYLELLNKPDTDIERSI